MTLNVCEHMWLSATVVSMLLLSYVSYVVFSSAGLQSVPVYWTSGAPDPPLRSWCKLEKRSTSALTPSALSWASA